MRIGLNTFVLHPAFSDEAMDSFQQIRAWGFDTVEMAVEHPNRLNGARARRMIFEAGLSAGVVCGVFGPGRDLRGTPAEQTASKEYLKRLIDLTAEVGADVICGPAYSCVGRAELYSPEERERHWDLVAENLSDVCADAQKAGVVLALEPLNRFETDFLNTCGQAKALVQHVGSNHLRIHLDTFHMNLEERSHAAAIAEAGALLAHVHASASHRGVIGEDTVPWAEVMKALQEIGYEGEIVFETFQREMPTLAAACKLWRPLFDSPATFATRSLKHLRSLAKPASLSSLPFSN